jgi:hypothetical protein
MMAQHLGITSTSLGCVSERVQWNGGQAGRREKGHTQAICQSLHLIIRLGVACVHACPCLVHALDPVLIGWHPEVHIC